MSAGIIDLYRMRRLFTQTLAIIALGLAALALFGCGKEKQAVWRQKMVLEVATPNGIKTGAAVVGVDVQIALRKNNANDGSPVAWKITGEAAAVDLGGGKYVFALLTGPFYYGQPGRNAAFAFSDPAKKMIVDSVDDVLAAAKNEPRALSGEGLPLLVTFTDIADPKTVRKVDPANLAASFGPGYALKSITLEITDEPVTEGVVEGVLGWLKTVWPNRLDGDRYGNLNSTLRFANSLSSNSFSTEIKK